MLNNLLIVTTLCFQAALASPLWPRAVGITTQVFNHLSHCEQWAAASYCPANFKDQGLGKPVACTSKNCPLVETANTTIVLPIPTSPIADTAGYVAIDTDSQFIVVAFRGSESIRNYLADLNLAFMDLSKVCAGCRGFTGMYSAWAEVEAGVIAAVKSAKNSHPDYKVIVTGHSLGAGIAVFGAVSLRNNGIPADMVTFGGPRVGNEAFVLYAMAQAPALGENFRVSHMLDPVPTLPALSTGYRHISPNYFINAEGDTPVALANIEVQEGILNENPTSSDAGVDSHGFYFNHISACWPQNIPIPFSVPT